MDGDNNSLNIRNWGYYEPTASLKGHLGLQLMSTMPEKPLLGSRNAAAVMVSANGGYHHRDMGFSQSMLNMDYTRDSWISPREKFINVMPENSSYGIFQETPSVNHMLMYQEPELANDDRVEQEEEEEEEEEEEKEEAPIMDKINVPKRKRQGPKAAKSPKAKKGKRGPRLPKADGGPSVQRIRSVKKSAEVVINGISMDISDIPIPICSCTGVPQQCYRWGCGGWQSACCTTGMSMYPLPMSTKRRGARIAGRKMSIGAFKKVLEKLASDGYDFSNPVDLRTHWAKHGTNKFVTIR